MSGEEGAFRSPVSGCRIARFSSAQTGFFFLGKRAWQTGPKRLDHRPWACRPRRHAFARPSNQWWLEPVFWTSERISLKGEQRLSVFEGRDDLSKTAGAEAVRG